MSSSRRRRYVTATAAIALVASGAIGATIVASDEEETGGTAPPGEQTSDEVGAQPQFPAPPSDGDALITTGGSTFDETILTKYIAADGFEVFQGDGSAADTIGNTVCRVPGSGSGGADTFLSGSLELPDGARIKRVHFFGQDNDAAADITVRLRRNEFTTPLGSSPTSTRSTDIVNQFSTSGQQADASVFSGADDLAEITGSFADSAGPVVSGTINRFHAVDVIMSNSAATDHVFCGIRVDYQVPMSTVEAGDQFHPVGPVRVYDSRLGSFTPNGVVTPGSNRVVEITDGYDLDGNPIPAQADTVPADATAVTYNITVTGTTGPNFTAVTAGDATAFTTSAINFGAGDQIANAGTVAIVDGEMKIWGGDNTGSAHVLIDITGYYAPGPPPSNMAN